MTIQFLTDSPFSSSVGSRPNPCLLDLVTDSRLYLPLKGLSTLWIPVFDWEYSPISPCILSLKASLNVSLVIVFSSNAWVAQSPRKIWTIRYLFWFAPIFSLVICAWGKSRWQRLYLLFHHYFSINSTTCILNIVRNCGWLDNITATCFTTNGDIFYFGIQGQKLSLWSWVLILSHFCPLLSLQNWGNFLKKTAFCQRSTLTSINLVRNIHM